MASRSARVLLFDATPAGELNRVLISQRVRTLEPKTEDELVAMVEDAAAFRAAVRWPSAPTESCLARLRTLAGSGLQDLVVFVVPGTAAHTAEAWRQYGVQSPESYEALLQVLQALL